MHSVIGLPAVLCGRREPCKPSTGLGKKGCTALNTDTFGPRRNGQKPPAMIKLRLHQVVEQSTGWVFAGRMVSEIVLGL